MLKNSLIPTILSIHLCISCTTTPHQPPVAALDQQPLTLTKAPKAFKTIHRVLLTVKGRELDFTGYLLYKSPDKLHVLGFAEAGDNLFEFKNNDSKSDIVKFPKFMNKETIRAGILADLFHIYQDSTVVSFDRQKKFKIYRTNQNQEVSTWTLNLSNDILKSISRKRSQKIRTVEYSMHANFPNVPMKFPRVINLENHRYNYQLRIETIELTPSLPATFEKS